MFRNLIESPLFNTIIGFTLLVGSGLNTLPVIAAEFLYGVQSPQVLPNTLSINGFTVLSTDQSQFELGSNNQGWWSATVSNDTFNSNYFVGDLSNDGSGLHNNFFTFDISEVLEPVTSATLNLLRNSGQSDSGRLTQSYSLFDVSTDAATLNNNVGTSSTIFDDLGSGKQYGNFNVTVSGDESEILSFSLNSDAIADLNSAISLNQQFFSVGGTLTPVPEPSSVLGLLTFAGLSLKAVAKRKKVEIK